MIDIVPELLEKLQNEFSKKLSADKSIIQLQKSIISGEATYKDANYFAIRVGELLSEVFQENLSSSQLPDGKMYFNIAERIINPTFKNNYDLVSSYSELVQETLNIQANIGVAVKIPEMNQDRLDGIINRISTEEDFDSVKWLLKEPPVNFSQAIVDDFIKANAEFHKDLGLSPKIIRKSTGKCCEWCNEIEGTYEYPDVPKDVYRRHQRCKCTVDYVPAQGKKQNVWSKGWR